MDPITGEKVIFARASSFGGWKVAPNEDGHSFSDSTTSSVVTDVVKALGRLRIN